MGTVWGASYVNGTGGVAWHGRWYRSKASCGGWGAREVCAGCTGRTAPRAGRTGCALAYILVRPLRPLLLDQILSKLQQGSNGASAGVLPGAAGERRLGCGGRGQEGRPHPRRGVPTLSAHPSLLPPTFFKAKQHSAHGYRVPEERTFMLLLGYCAGG